MKTISNLIKATIAMAIVVGMYSCQKTEVSNPSTSSQNSAGIGARLSNNLVFPVQAHMYGKTLADWGAALLNGNFNLTPCIHLI